MRLVIPSETGTGLASVRSGHFGHAPYFTVITIEDGKIVGIEPVESIGHGEGGCGNVIQFIIGLDVDAILTVGMGMRPLSTFAAAGIQVYTDDTMPMVGAAAQKFIAGGCRPMTLDDACRH
jgi:predicted Fe-Mo cluster-binding NifX family protein